MRRSDGLIPYIDMSGEGAPIYERIYDGIRSAILSGRFPPGARLPSTRSLAEDLGVARMTAVRGYEMLKAEGYIDAGVGSGSHVAEELPDHLLRAPEGGGPFRRPDVHVPPADPPPLSHRGRTLLRRVNEALLAATPRPFVADVPATGAFPYKTWGTLDREVESELAGVERVDPAGDVRLREAIATWVAGTRGGTVDPDQVLIASGVQEALRILADLLLDPSAAVLLEEPGRTGVRLPLEQICEVVGAPVDREGCTLPPRALGTARSFRMAWVTPSCHFPSGEAMTPGRRRELLEWAEWVDAWVVEDDRWGEFRYTGRPLPSLASLDRSGRVVYVGDFRTMLAPRCELVYLVMPPRLVDAAIGVRTLHGRPPDIRLQRVLAHFIEGGHYARHVRTMRELYRSRQEVVVEALRTGAPGLELGGLEAGAHLTARFRDGRSLGRVLRRGRESGLHLLSVSAFGKVLPRDDGLVLGYGGFESAALRDACETLLAAMG